MKRNSNGVDPNFRPALCAVLCAQAIAISFFESLIPEIPFLPPGAKPGLSNIITMFAANSLGLSEALIITLAKSLFAFATRGFTAFIMSISGGLLSCLAAWLLLTFAQKKLGFIGISVICSLCHNFGQLCASCVITGSRMTFYYAPFLALFGVITGVITGVIFAAVLPALDKMKKYIRR
ncbi:MAG: Gx transporter family protein [Clostridia bacterium]|nr:Gx transporter family protein [Clostridia bacterium]